MQGLQQLARELLELSKGSSPVREDAANQDQGTGASEEGRSVCEGCDLWSPPTKDGAEFGQCLHPHPRQLEFQNGYFLIAFTPEGIGPVFTHKEFTCDKWTARS